MPTSQRQTAKYGPVATPLSVEVRPLPPALGAAAWALWHYRLDMQCSGSLHEASAALLAALPLVEGYEDDLRQMVEILVNDVRQQTPFNEEARYKLRFSNAYEDLDDLLSGTQRMRVTVIPVAAEYSYHANVAAGFTDAFNERLDALHGEHFAFIAAVGAEAEDSDPDDDFVNLRRPLTSQQLAQYRGIGRLIAQACADALNQGMEAQAALAGALGSIRGAALRLVSSVAIHQSALDRPAIATTSRVNNDNDSGLAESARGVRTSAIDLERGIKRQMGNAGLSAAMHYALRSGLQQLQEMQIESGIKPRVQRMMTKKAALSLIAKPVRNEQQIRPVAKEQGTTTTKATPKVVGITSRPQRVAKLPTKAEDKPVGRTAVIVAFRKAADDIKASHAIGVKSTPSPPSPSVEATKARTLSKPKNSSEVRISAKGDISVSTGTKARSHGRRHSRESGNPSPEGSARRHWKMQRALRVPEMDSRFRGNDANGEHRALLVSGLIKPEPALKGVEQKPAPAAKTADDTKAGHAVGTQSILLPPVPSAETAGAQGVTKAGDSSRANPSVKVEAPAKQGPDSQSAKFVESESSGASTPWTPTMVVSQPDRDIGRRALHHAVGDAVTDMNQPPLQVTTKTGATPRDYVSPQPAVSREQSPKGKEPTVREPTSAIPPTLPNQISRPCAPEARVDLRPPARHAFRVKRHRNNVTAISTTNDAVAHRHQTQRAGKVRPRAGHAWAETRSNLGGFGKTMADRFRSAARSLCTGLPGCPFCASKAQRNPLSGPK